MLEMSCHCFFVVFGGKGATVFVLIFLPFVNKIGLLVTKWELAVF